MEVQEYTKIGITLPTDIIQTTDNCDAQELVMIEYILNDIRRWFRESTWDKCFDCLKMSRDDAISEFLDREREDE